MKLLKEAAYPTNEYTDRLKDISEKYGYTIIAYNRKYDASDKLFPYIKIYQLSSNPTFGSIDFFLPRIYFDDAYGNGDYKFTIGTTSYGSLELDELSSFLIAMNQAYDLVRILSKIDISKLPIMERGV